MSRSRREFLEGLALGAAALTVGCPSEEPEPPQLPVLGPWGAAPEESEGLLLPSGVRAENVLEIFMYGGLGPFESFYVVPDRNGPNDPLHPNQQWHLFADQHASVFACTGLDPVDWIQSYAVDAAGQRVSLGPTTAPLRARPDLLDRMRVLVQHHEAEPHEAAIPLALSGQRLGSPRMAGMGTAAQRFHQARDGGERTVPYSYVLIPATEIATDNLRAASAVGLHPGSARPLTLRMVDGGDIAGAMARQSVQGRREAHDALLDHWASQTQRRLDRAGASQRSRALEDYRAMLGGLRDHQSLAALFPASLQGPFGSLVCGQEATDLTKQGLRNAVNLLTHPTSPARHVTVVDGGLIPAAGGGSFDTHDTHLRDTTRNLVSLLETLTSLVNEPGEGDPGKLDLDRTLIILNTEFGRTPFEQEGSERGTNHHPYGYVQVMFGGPIGPDQAGLVGAIGADGWASEYVTPVEARCAALVAMGIYPFTNESFAIGDIRDFGNEREGLVWLTEHVLGRAV